LAALVAVGVASAQSSVTIYGTLDASSGHLKRTQSETGLVSTTQKVTNLAGLNSSRGTNLIGFRGTEDLGGGMTASFTYEFGLNAQNVATNGNLAAAGAGGNGGPFGQTRQAWIGLGAKDMGEVRLGSQNNLTVPIGGMSAAIQEVAIGGSTMGQLNGLATTRNPLQIFGATTNTFTTPGVVDGVNSIAATLANSYLSPTQGVSGPQPRYSNVLSYTSPTMMGFRASVQLVKEHSSNPAGLDVATTGINGAVSKLDAQLYGLEYDNGPLAVKVLLTQKKLEAGRTANANGTAVAADLAVDSNKVSHTVIAANYNFGVATPYVIYHQGDNKAGRMDGAASTLKIATDGYELGVRVPVGAFTPYLSVSRGEWKATATGINATTVKLNTMQVGTTYTMSKRTTLYAATGSSKFKATEAGVAGDAQDKQSGFRLGVTHAF
jgi:predicted porin